MPVKAAVDQDISQDARNILNSRGMPPIDG
jgi:antitoxin component of MazEF toxin-antitoxin module